MPASPASERSTLLIVAIVATAFFMEALDGSIILTALPTMAGDLGTTPVGMSSGLTAYMLALAVASPASGWLADRFGTRAVFCWAVTVFTVASVLCGLSQNLPAFVAARVVQGAAGALMGPVGRLVVLRTAPKDQLVRAVNWMTLPWLAAPVIGPAIGGFITEQYGWRWTFFVNVPIGVLGVILGLALLPQHRSEERRPFDLKGLALTAAALAGIVFGLELAGSGKLTVGAPLVLAGGGLAIFALRHARSTPHPLIDLSAAKITTFRVAGLSAGSVTRIALTGLTFVLPLMLQIAFGLEPFLAGLIMVGMAAGDLIIKAITTRTVRLLGFRTLLLTSSVAFAACSAAPVLFTEATSPWLMFAVLFVVGAVRSLTMTGLTALQFADVPQSAMTGASTLQWLAQQGSRSVGIALGALGLNVLAAVRHPGLPPGEMDFKLMLLVFALPIAACCLSYWRLPRDAGAQASGHQPRQTVRT